MYRWNDVRQVDASLGHQPRYFSKPRYIHPRGPNPQDQSSTTRMLTLENSCTAHTGIDLRQMTQL